MAIQAMNIAINDRKLLPNRDRLKNRLGRNNSDKKAEYNIPIATAKQLKAIRKRLEEERKIRMIKVIGFSTIIILGLVWLLLTL